jgi:Peptidase family S41
MRAPTLKSVLCLAMSGMALPALAQDWAAIARQDLDFAADAIRTRHVGYVAGMPSVTMPYDAGLRLARAEAEGVRSEQDYRRMMMRFVAGFGDPHMGIDLHLAVHGWTGIVLDQTGGLNSGRYRVSWSEPGWPTPLPPPGSIAQSCDDVWTGTWLQLRVAPFTNRGAEYATASGAFAQQVMFDYGLGWTPTQCVFVLPDGSRKRYELPLRSVPGEVAQQRIDAIRPRFRATAKPVGLTTLGPGMHWVGMPNFDGERSGAAYEALYPKLAALPKSGWIVFDLRGNGGGDSTWGSRALAALYGATYAGKLGEAGGASKYQIADAETANLLRRYIAEESRAASKASFDADLAKVEAAMRAGQKVVLLSGDPDVQPGSLKLPRPHGPRIAALIDRTCFSSCMNFVQRLRAASDTVVLGEATIGYSPFGEIDRHPLPSGRGALVIPSALFKTATAVREPFVPDIAFDGNMADDAALQQWVRTTLDRMTK